MTLTPVQGIGATVVQLLALAACAVATVLTALSLVQDISSLTAGRLRSECYVKTSVKEVLTDTVELKLPVC